MTTFAADEDLAERASTADPDDFTDKIQGDKDYQSYPLGWPRLAAYYNQFNNADSFRRFRYPIVRLILHRGLRCAFLDRKLQEYDQTHDAHLRGLTENQKLLPGQPRVPDDYEDLMEEQEKAVFKYIKLLSCYSTVRQFHAVPQSRYDNLLKMNVMEGMLEKEGYMLFDSHLDMASVTEPMLPGAFVDFMHSRYGRWFLGLLASTDSDSHSRLLRMSTAEVFLKGFLIIIQAVLLLIPIGFLFLGHLDKRQSFGLITGFTLLFSIVMMLSRDGDMHKTLVGVCAFCAVLFTISAQFSGESP